MRILVTARYVEGTAYEGGSGRFMRTVIDTLANMGHDVLATNYPNEKDIYDLIIVSHQEPFNMIKYNDARKVYISHGVIEDERFLPGADKYISVSEEVQKANLQHRAIKSDIINQPIRIGEYKRPSDVLEKILIIRTYELKDDPFACLFEKYDIRISDPEVPIEKQIEWADLCITLGRGALESMAQGKPVLVADNRSYIGPIGDGYVTPENISEIAKCNFSGRRYWKEITEEWLESELAKYNPDDSEFLYQYVKENHDAKKTVAQYLEMTQIHIVTSFSRIHLLDTIIHHYEPMKIIWHPIVFEKENRSILWPAEKGWIHPFVVPDEELDFVYTKYNEFIRKSIIQSDDYYIFLDDQDMIEKDTVRKLREMTDDVVFISMKRGYKIPENALFDHGVSTFTADEENVKAGQISIQQYVTKGQITKRLSFFADILAGEWLKQNFPIRYEPDIYSLFNYFEPGRWDKPDIITGVLINDIYRFNTILRKSDLPGDVKYVINPESATKGINTLLGIMKQEEARIGIIVHQDMYFRNGWIQKVEEQLNLLPDSWVVAGIVGKDMHERICGKFRDMRMVDTINTSHIHEFPQPAASFDECVLIFNLEKDFRFDESLDGFDLYGTLAVLQTWEMGGTAWIIDAFAEHYCMRPFSWVPDDDFKRRFKMLYDRYNEKFGVVDSTAFVNKPKLDNHDYEFTPRFGTGAGA